MEPMDPGESQRYVRCRRCHGVFEEGLPNCTRCGTPYFAPAAETAALPDSYADKYQGSAFAEPEVVVAPRPAGGRSTMGILMALGALLLVAALIGSAFVMMGGADSKAPPTGPAFVAAITPTPIPTPTMPAAVAKTLAMIADPNLNLHVSLRTTVTISARVNPGGRSAQRIFNSEIDCAEGNELGTEVAGNVTTEWRLVSGVYYVRTLPTGKWQAKASFTPFIVLSPLFSLTEERQIRYVGSETKNGLQTDKLENTNLWAPDAGRLSGFDVLTLPVRPDTLSLQLWVASDGAPVYALFRASKTAADGTNDKLVDVQTTYTFTNQGAVQPIPSPSMK
jgi:hypothetical protein